MNQFKYSPSTNYRYPVDFLSSYEEAGTLPDDLVDIDDEISKVYFDSLPPEGKIRVAGNDGLPAWGDIPPPSKESLIMTADTQKSMLRRVADSEIAWRQDAVDAEIATDEETAKLAAWKKYRVLLMRVDTSTAPDIKWPQEPQRQ